MTSTQIRERMKPRAMFLLGMAMLILLTTIATGVSRAHAEVVCTSITIDAIAADIFLICKEVEDEDDGPDCGKNPYVWNPIGQHYQRKFHEACYFVTWDENEKTYHDLWLDQTPLGP